MRCVYCQQVFSENLSLKELISWEPLSPHELCLRCRGLFQLNDRGPNCLGCDKPGIEGYCAECQLWQLRYPKRALRHEALYCYDEALHDWFQQYKFKGDLTLARSFNQNLRSYLKGYATWVIVPIPLSESRLRSRGFNQVEALLEGAGIDFVSLLQRSQAAGPQSNKTRAERLRMRQPFVLGPKARAQIEGKKVLIVDDVYTTGRTMMHARERIEGAAPSALKTFSLAR